MIVSVGDSHSTFSFLGIPEVRINDIGPITMESVGKSRQYQTSSDMLDMILSRATIQEADIAIMCFGEIDMRCGVQPKIDAGHDEDDVIIDLVSNYIYTIQGSQHKNIWVLSITPAAYSAGLWNNPTYPFLGSDKDRARYTRKANEVLRSVCLTNNITFLDVYDKYADSNGMLKKELTNDGVHIGNTTLVREVLLTLINKEE